VASAKHRDLFVGVLYKEIKLKGGYLGDEKVNTIYFGGGTPSLLTTGEINRIIDELNNSFNMADDLEITLEANPDDLNKKSLCELRATSVNRLSIGVQSFYDDDLEYLNRVHNSVSARNSINQAREAGFDNLTIDLIYGIPTLTSEKWRANLESFLKLNIPHLSAYALTVEPKTSLANLIRKNKLPGINEESSIHHFNILLDTMKNNEYVHYEISNFARPDFYSKHNSIYWLGGNYLGLGPSAHSYNGQSRHWNVMSLEKYMCLQDFQSVVKETEFLTKKQQFNEYVMTSLRTSWGCDTEHIRNVFGDAYHSHFQSVAQQYIEEGKLLHKINKYYLSDLGKLFADGLAAEFFLDE